MTFICVLKVLRELESVGVCSPSSTIFLLLHDPGYRVSSYFFQAWLHGLAAARTHRSGRSYSGSKDSCATPWGARKWAAGLHSFETC